MQNINYDQVLKGASITITLQGTEYEVEEPTLGQVLAFEKATKEIEDCQDDILKMVKQIEKVIRIIYTGLPSDVLSKYSGKALYQMLMDVRQLVMESTMPGVVSQKEQEPPKKGTQSKKK